MAKARVLLCWELGAGFGHLVALRALAEVLRDAGHDCAFAVRNLGSANEFLDPKLGPVYQAPVKLGASRTPVRTQVSFASLLHNTGFDDVHELAGRIEGWRNLMRAVKATAVVTDHAPVAALAARTLSLPVLYSGSGFTVPPLQAPFPSFRPRMNVPLEILQKNEAQVLNELNQALARLSLKPCTALQDIYRGAIPALLSYEPLDHYEGARPEPFLGMPDYSHGADPEWPQGKGPKLFAYLRPGPTLPALMEALKDSPARVLLRLSGVPAREVKAWARPGLMVLESGVNFRKAAESCDAFLNYGAHSTVAEFLLSGKPGLLMPDLHERVLTTRRAVSLGAAVAVRGKDVAPVRQALAQLLDDPKLRLAAEGFAARYRPQDRSAILPAMVKDFI